MTAPACLLFDLDGTLADTAPELAAAVNALRADHGLAALPFDQLRPVCSQGARGLVGRAFGVMPEDDRFPALRDAFLAHYGAGHVRNSRPFAGVPEMLDAIQRQGALWGIVTNKPRAYAEPLVAALGWDEVAAVMIAGDDAARAKPAPDPLLLACESLALAPAQCHYIGDDPRDIVAARAAGMPCTAVSWGYIDESPDIGTWGADAIRHAPAEIAVCLLPAA